jgi:Na+-translocating ferredoxin:NAD+ oxidoreductase RnfD subunit
MRGLRRHALLALLSIMALILVNMLVSPRYPWWMFVAAAWCAPFAVHVAYAMEIFGNKG